MTLRLLALFTYFGSPAACKFPPLIKVKKTRSHSPSLSFLSPSSLVEQHPRYLIPPIQTPKLTHCLKCPKVSPKPTCTYPNRRGFSACNSSLTPLPALESLECISQVVAARHRGPCDWPDLCREAPYASRSFGYMLLSRICRS